jgi:hypothetical protein
MTRKHVTFAAGLVAAATGSLLSAGNLNFTPGTVPGTYLGPSTLQTPYVNPTAPGWEVISLLSVGESAKNEHYMMAGIPDGLGALAGRIGDGGRVVAENAFMTVLMNHEIPEGQGGFHAHGRVGAFVSQWSIHLNTLEVRFGQDLVRDVFTWNALAGGYDLANGLPTSEMGRLCSADLPAVTAFYNPATGRGYDGRIYLNGEEVGNEGRAFAHFVTGPQKGESYELAHHGKFSWENIVAHPGSGDKTIVVGLDDSTPGQVYVYVGDKRADGNPLRRTGLLGGKLWGIKVTDGGANYGGGAVPRENAGAINGAFVLEDVSDVATGTGVVLNSTSISRGITDFARPEDGQWDTQDPNVFYFVTTGATINGAAQTARLYKLTFDSLTNPTGGTIALVRDAATLTGTDGQTGRSFDNITVDGAGWVLVQEDPGNSSYIAKTWRINGSTGAAVQILESDRSRFITGAPNFLTQDEESSGIIEVTHIVRNANWYEEGRRYYLADMQAHYNIPRPEMLVQGGQLYLVISPKQ